MVVEPAMDELEFDDDRSYKVERLLDGARVGLVEEREQNNFPFNR